jgi:ketosteroid isomerase-like protein
MLGAEIKVFGNVAVAMAACENTENGTTITRNVEALLLVKEDGAWKIVSQAWDTESETNPVPAHLLC